MPKQRKRFWAGIIVFQVVFGAVIFAATRAYYQPESAPRATVSRAGADLDDWRPAISPDVLAGLTTTEAMPDDPATTVTLSYRSGAFTRAKPKNRERVDDMEAAGKLRVLFNSNVTAIGEKDVTIDCQGSSVTIPNDAVVISAGGILPSGFLRSIGIEVETKWGSE